VRLINLSHALAIAKLYEGTSKDVGNEAFSIDYDGHVSVGLLKEKERNFFIDGTKPDIQGIDT
jgi:hypothetical protein